jgi:hypothetical protein
MNLQDDLSLYTHQTIEFVATIHLSRHNSQIENRQKPTDAISNHCLHIEKID